MPKVAKNVAKHDIYTRGAQVPSPKTKKGTRLDRSKPFDENDTVLIKTGETYYTWSINFGGTYIQKTPPTASQLTTSEFLKAAYDINDRLAAFSADSPEDVESGIDEIKSEIENLRDETQEKFDNMPDGLREGDTGQLLEERVEACDECINELDQIDIDFEPYEKDEEGDEDEEEEAANEHESDWISDKVGEVKDCTINV